MTDMLKSKSNGSVTEATDPREKIAEQQSEDTQVICRPNNSASNRQSYVTVGILCFYSLTFSMNLNGPSGLLLKIQSSFNVSEALLGLMSLMFVIGCILVSPIVGYLADRHSRRTIMIVNVTLWSLGSLCATFIPDNLYGLFLAFRLFDGLGSATHAAITPAVISDLFVGNRRSQLLALYYFMTPVGAGLGYILCSMVGNALGWRWGMRITPLIGFLCVALIVAFFREPKRGQSEGLVGELASTSLKEDFKYLVSNRSYVMCCTATLTACFVIGTIGLWGPSFFSRGLAKQDRCNELINNVSSIFGAVSIAAGIVGILSGSVLGMKLRPKFQQSCDSLICGWTMLASVPLMYASLMLADKSFLVTIIVCFPAVVLYYMSLALAGEIILYVVVPNRRAVGKSLQNVLNHLLGDGGGPFVIGMITDALKPVVDRNSVDEATPTDCAIAPFIDYDNLDRDFVAQQYSMFVFLFVQVICASCFLILSRFISKDVEHVAQAITETNLTTKQTTTE